MKIESSADLRKHYAMPKERAVNKSLNALEQHCRYFISKSPFCIISTIDAAGHMDASPRGGEAGFVKVLDDQTLAIPDAKGNNRLDSLENIVETGKIGMLFLIPGIDETLRLNGNAFISTDVIHLGLFNALKNLPTACIVVKVEEAFLHCAKAFMRSKLWDVNSQIDKADFPTMGQMLKDQLQIDAPAETREEMIKRYAPDI